MELISKLFRCFSCGGLAHDLHFKAHSEPMRACARCVRVGNGNAARLVTNGAARHVEHCLSDLALDFVSVRNQGKIRLRRRGQGGVRERQRRRLGRRQIRRLSGDDVA